MALSLNGKMLWRAVMLYTFIFIFHSSGPAHPALAASHSVQNETSLGNLLNTDSPLADGDTITIAPTTGNTLSINNTTLFSIQKTNISITGSNAPTHNLSAILGLGDLSGLTGEALKEWRGNYNLANILQETENWGASLTTIDGGSGSGNRAGPLFLNNNNAGENLSFSNLRFVNVDTVYSTSHFGGGVISATSSTGSSALGGFDSIFFNGAAVTIGDTFFLQGGGLIGAYSPSSSSIGNINNSIFNGNSVNAGSYLYGGGIIGVYSTTTSSIGNVSNALFSGNSVSADSSLLGGGIIGAESSFSSSIGGIRDSTFSGNSVNEDSNLDGGGIIGVFSLSSSSIGEIRASTFNGNSVNAGSYLYGGGIIGAYSPSFGYPTSSSIGNVNNSIFNGNSVNAGSNLQGGGIIGAYSSSSSSIGNISNALFSGNSVDATNSHLYGGGIIGTYSTTTSSIGNVSNALFSGNSVSADSSLLGGGIIGAYSFYPSSSIGGIRDSTFSGNSVNVGSNLQGGGIIGVFSLSSSSIGEIRDSTFSGNIISAQGEVRAGLVYSSGLNSELIIANSRFYDNVITSADGSVYGGAVGIGTMYETENPAGHVLTLRAENNGETVFQNNTINGGSGNAVYMGHMGGNSLADAVLNINAETGGAVYLFDPVITKQNNDMSFSMTVRGSGGDFFWGGENIFEVTGSGTNTLLFESGSRATLLSGFSLASNTGNLTATFESGSTLVAEPTADPANLAPRIEADAMFIKNDAAFDTALEVFYYDDTLLRANDRQIILRLKADGGLAGTGIPQSGRTSVGVYDYTYNTAWENPAAPNERNLIFTIDSINYSKELAASSAVMGPGVMAHNLPANRAVLARLRGILSRNAPQPPIPETLISAVRAPRNHESDIFTTQKRDGNRAEDYLFSPDSGQVTGSAAFGRAFNACNLHAAGTRAGIGSPSNFWMMPSYSFTRRDKGGSQTGYDLHTAGGSLGYDHGFANGNAALGIALSVFNQAYNGSYADIDSQTYLAQAYGGVRLPRGFGLLGFLGYGRVDYDQTRKVRGQKLDADYDGTLLSAGTELGWRHALTEHLEFRPFVSYDYLRVDADGYTEKKGDGTYNLRVSGHGQNLHRYRVGAGLEWRGETGIAVGGQAYYQGLSGDTRAETDLRFIADAAGTRWRGIGGGMERSSVGTEIYVTLPLADNVALTVDYGLGLADTMQSHQGNVSLRISF